MKQQTLLSRRAHHVTPTGMKLFIFTCIFALSMTVQAQTVLGHWKGSVNLSDRYGTYSRFCENLSIDLIKNERNEVVLHSNFDCILGEDWFISDTRAFSLDAEGNLLGEDGYLKDNEFYWDISPAYQDGTKYKLTLVDTNTLRIENTARRENDKYNGLRISGTLHRANEPMKDQDLWSPKLSGQWQVDAEILHKDSQGKLVAKYKCSIDRWTINDQNSVWFQNSLYFGDCDKSGIGYWYGAFFFEYNKVYEYDPSRVDLGLIEVGTYTSNGFQLQEKRLNTNIELEILDANTLRLHRTSSFMDMRIYPYEYKVLELTAIIKRL